MPSRKRSRRLDWAKFTDFRYRHTRTDLIKACDGLKRSELEEIFSSADATGLYPIHWAAVHNRSDMIDFMVDNGSQILLKCKNKLFAQGSALHLAAMNGSIEAASMLFSKCDQLDRNQTKFKTLDLPSPVTGNESKLDAAAKDTPNVAASNISNKSEASLITNLLNMRDSEGQTALMRTASPRSKRLDIIRDLLRKNFWSLNGRPAEIALFLIIKGSDWRETDPSLGMNLMHLAIVNGYDDIVNLLLVLDMKLLEVPTKLKGSISSTRTRPSSASSKDEFDTINLTSSTSPSISPISSIKTSSPAGSDSSSYQPLVDGKEKLNNLLDTGITPLQLSIIYGRLSIISLLWRASRNNHRKQSDGRPSKKISSIYTTSELRSIILQAFFTSRTELKRFVKSALLKTLLVLDIAVLVVVWMPAYFSSVHNDNSGERITYNLAGGIFLISFLVTLISAFRVMFRSPGYLKRETASYYKEITAFVEDRPNQYRNQNLVIEREATQNERKSNSGLEERIKLLCHKCRCIRRPRSWHCNQCDHCVQDFDHHCIYLGCCIGRKNRLDFLVMMITLTITSIYGTILQASSLSQEQWFDFVHLIGFIWIFKYALIGGISAFFIIRRACLGVTMFEMIRSNRIRNVFGPNGPPAEISKSHSIFATFKGSFWRYSPNRFLTGDLPLREVLTNFREFTNQTSVSDYFLAMACSDSQLTKSVMVNSSHPETRIDIE